jgi:hypothetical protein
MPRSKWAIYLFVIHHIYLKSGESLTIWDSTALNLWWNMHNASTCLLTHCIKYGTASEERKVRKCLSWWNTLGLFDCTENRKRHIRGATMPQCPVVTSTSPFGNKTTMSNNRVPFRNKTATLCNPVLILREQAIISWVEKVVAHKNDSSKLIWWKMPTIQLKSAQLQ